jgi:hypothetical protein
LLTWKHFQLQWNLQNNIIIIACENKKALNQVDKLKHYVGSLCKTPEYDIMEAIRQLLKSEEYYCQHTTGHQMLKDNKRDVFIELNLMAHDVAVETQKNNRQHSENNYLVSGLEKWQVVFKGQKIT